MMLQQSMPMAMPQFN
jgi:hypothetical protein